jgi:osmotically-inducible protein OsmY
MKVKFLAMAAVLAITLCGSGCSKTHTTYKDSVKTGLEQADLRDVTVTEDADKNTITLGGTLHSEEAKQQAANVAKSNGGGRIVVNEISVRPVGQESVAKSVASNLDDGIESNYKAALVSKGLDKQHIRFDAKNGVLTLKGNVKNNAVRQEAERLAQAVPNVQQVLNEIDAKK